MSWRGTIVKKLGILGRRMVSVVGSVCREQYQPLSCEYSTKQPRFLIYYAAHDYLLL